MATTHGCKATVSTAVEPGGRGPDRIQLNAEQREAINFLRSPAEAVTKILVGDPSTGKTTLLDQVCAERKDFKVLRTGGGTGASLMTSLLHSAGLNPEKLSRGVRKNLLTVFLEHQKTIGRKIVIAVDAAEQLEPEDWSELERLHTLQSEKRADFELIIVGRPKVYEHLRSPLGRWHRVRARFHTLRPVNKSPSPELPADSEHLIITQYGEVIDRPALKARMMVGRNTHNDICLKHPSVSRHHALIASTPDGYYVADLHSKSGLRVNGERVTTAILRNNDILILGPYRLKLVVSSAESHRDSHPPEAPLADTATMRVKALRRRLEGSLLGAVNSSES